MRQNSAVPWTFREALELAPLVPAGSRSGAVLVRRYMSLRQPWIPGASLFVDGHRKAVVGLRERAFGGNVYSGAGLAACRALEDDFELQPGQQPPLGLHVSFSPAPCRIAHL